jgi:hypothetical protein
MNDFVCRPVPFDSHPVVQQTYILPTPSIDTAYEQVKICIRHRTPGALMLGQSRFGKTYGIKYMESMLREDFPNIVSINFSCQKKKKPVEAAFFENLLDAAGHKDPLSGTTSAKRKRLIERLLELAYRSNSKFLVVFADEAHRLDVIEYEWLWDIHDALHRHGVRTITFLVGMQKLKNQKNAFRAAGETSVISRFMIDEIPFNGLLSAEDVATCLKGYDEANFPESSDWSYTRYFLPRAWQEGLRLEVQALELWNAFERAHCAAGFQFKIEIPMTYFARAVEIALMDYAEKDSEDFQFSETILNEVVEASKYVVAVEELRMDPNIDD